MIEYQSFLARLYTSDVFRRLNRIDPVAAQAFFVLDADSRADLLKLDLDAVDDFARCLSERLRRRLQSIVPVTSQAMGEDRFARAFARFHSLHAPHPGETKVALITKFGLFIEDFLRADPAAPDWLPELARFEHAVVEASVQGENAMPLCKAGDRGFETGANDSWRLADGLKVSRYDYDVVALMAQVKDAQPIAQVAGCITHVVTVPRPGSRRPRVLRVPALAADLLASVAVTSVAKSWASRSAAMLQPALSRSEVESALRQLFRMGLVTT